MERVGEGIKGKGKRKKNLKSLGKSGYLYLKVFWVWELFYFFCNLRIESFFFCIRNYLELGVRA